ncbi:MAG TPA: dethiobiotin synthase [Solirubrobacteraceae bacterium]|nr:dethiobiotin synthase [Solirubrobacteraceae bacterium]
MTGTDTGAGKSVVAAALLAAIAAEGVRVRAHKPAVSGLEEPSGTWPPDHELLAAISGSAPEEVSPLRYGPAVSPQHAAELEGEPIDPETLLVMARAAGQGAPVIVEGAGGLLSPLARDYTVCDLAVSLELPVVIAARAGLGTINHSLLTLRAARAAGLIVRAVVLTPWPAEPSRLELYNRETISRMGEVEVVGLPPLSGPDPLELARAGAELPWRRWLSAGSA